MKKIQFRFIIFTVLMMFIPVAVFASNDLSSEQLLEREPVDVVIKYIDLTDPNLKREGIPQIKKDEDNDELKYAVRSVLKNLPWVRKIHVVMPNEKVRYFKDPSLISDKISYIKDKDVLGYDSASSVTFEFNFWKLKKFGVSENFIYMNDDCFIGKKMKKSDFFYVDNNKKVVPYVMYSKGVGKNQYNKISKLYSELKKQVVGRGPHTGEGFKYQRFSSLMFLYKVLGKDIFVPSEDMYYCHHNALGENLSDLKELYDIVKRNDPDAYYSTEAIVRDNRALQHQTLYSFYALNKHKRRINKINSLYVNLSSAPYFDYDVPLFCINTGGSMNYSKAHYAWAKIVMNKLFPVPTPYEIRDVENGTYYIESSQRRDRVLDIESASKNDGANLRLWEKNGTDAQKFRIVYQSDGTCIIIPKCSGKRIDVCCGSFESGANVQQYSRNGTRAQRWYFIPAGGEYYYLVSALNNLCADLEWGKDDVGTNIRCWEANGTGAQKFKLVKTV